MGMDIFFSMIDPAKKKYFAMIILVLIGLGLLGFPPGWVNLNAQLFNLQGFTIARIFGFLSILFAIWLSNRSKGL